MFEYKYELYEIIMTACTEKEEAEWTRRMTRASKDEEDTQRVDPVCSLALDVKSLGPTFGKNGEVFPKRALVGQTVDQKQSRRLEEHPYIGR